MTSFDPWVVVVVLSVFFPLKCNIKAKGVQFKFDVTLKGQSHLFQREKMINIWCLFLLSISTFPTGRLLSVHHSHVNLRKITTKHTGCHCNSDRDAGHRHDVMERGRLWGEVHLHCERPASGTRVRKPAEDPGWEILTQKSGPEVLPQLSRGTQHSRLLYWCRGWRRIDLLGGFVRCRKKDSLVYLKEIYIKAGCIHGG